MIPILTPYSPDTEVNYDPSTHTYFLGGTLYRSATTIVSQFYEPFNTKAKAEHMAFKYGRTPEYWRDKWSSDNTISLVRGNDIHDRQEQFLYDKGFTRVTGDRVHPVIKLHTYNQKKRRSISPTTLVDGCYPELKLWRHDWAIAGRADKPTIETVLSHCYAHVEDYKTNKELQRNGYVDKYGNERMMLYPIEHLPDCEMTHYTLQLSIYQYMLEYFGFLPGLRRIIHFPHEIEGLGIPDPKVIELPYLRNEIETMLTHLNNIKWLAPSLRIMSR